MVLPASANSIRPVNACSKSSILSVLISSWVMLPKYIWALLLPLSPAFFKAATASISKRGIFMAIYAKILEEAEYCMFAYTLALRSKAKIVDGVTKLGSSSMIISNIAKSYMPIEPRPISCSKAWKRFFLPCLFMSIFTLSSLEVPCSSIALYSWATW